MNLFKFSWKKLGIVIILEIVFFILYEIFQSGCGIPEPGQNPLTYCMNSIQYFLIILIAIVLIYLLIIIINSLIKIKK
jgi:hypothetical protein